MNCQRCFVRLGTYAADNPYCAPCSKVVNRTQAAQSRLVAAVENIKKVWDSYDDCVAVLGITEAENQRDLAMQALRAAVEERGKV